MSTTEHPQDPRAGISESSEDPAFTYDLQVIREAERKQIDVRRAKANIDAGDETIGLALSGGGLRSACFSMGVLQAFDKVGLFRFFDYLSSVSGGGYIGAQIAAHPIEGQKSCEEDFPLREVPDKGHQQTGRVLRLSYGGYYLMRPLTMLNKYLIGVLLNNLAILSAMVGISALIAFLWRCLDYPYVRDHLALLHLGSDLVVPFIPYFVLAICWLTAWLLSYFKRQAEAPGTIAGYLFIFKFGALLIGIAILIGNGDIAMPASIRGWFANQHVSVPPYVWGTMVVLTLVAVLPIFRPQRLLRSGTRPQHAWEKWVFNSTSFAMLCGLPLILVGWFGRENISGYSTIPNRGLHRAEVMNWPSLSALILHGEEKADSDSQENTTLLLKFTSSRFWEALAGQAVDGEGSLQGGLRGRLSFPQHSLPIKPLGQNDTEWQTLLKAVAASDLAEFMNKELGTDLTAKRIETFKKIADSTDAPRIPVWKMNMERDTRKSLPETVRQDPMQFLQYLAVRIIQADQTVDVARRKLDNLDRSQGWEASEYHMVEWEPLRIDDYFKRCLAFVSYSFGLKPNSVEDYMTARRDQRRLQDQFVIVFDLCVLPSTELTDHVREYASLVKQRDAAAHDRFNSLILAANRSGSGDVHDQQLAGINRELLTVTFPRIFRPNSDYQRRVVIYADQVDRLLIMLAALGFFLCIGMWIDVNATSMHRFYRVQLSKAFLNEYPKSRKKALSEITPHHYGYPYPLFCASVSMFRRQLIGGSEEAIPSAEHQNEDPRWVDTFVMSPDYCGSCNTGFVPTTSLENGIVGTDNTLSLGDVMAMSGAAVSPSQNTNWLIAFMMFAFNLRLGQWLPKPGVPDPRWRPRFINIFTSLVKPAEDRKYCFVSDGGHSENLGLVELLKRRCQLIIVSDAGQDQEHEFSDLARAVRTARIHGGVQITALTKEDADHSALQQPELSLAPLELKPETAARLQNKDGEETEKQLICEQHFVVARILYPKTDTLEEATGLLVYLKPSITGDESIDVLQYRKQHATFPHEPTSDQFFSNAQIEAYRNLGYHIAMQVCAALSPEEGRFGPDVTPNALTDSMTEAYLGSLPTEESAKPGANPNKAQDKLKGKAK